MSNPRVKSKRLSRALPGAAETQAMAAEALAIEQGVAAEQIAAAEGLALHAAAFNGMPDPVLHLAGRAMGLWSPAWPRSNPTRAAPGEPEQDLTAAGSGEAA